MFNVFPNSANRLKEEDFGLYSCICFSLYEDLETHFCNLVVIAITLITIVCVVSNDSTPACLRQRTSIVKK